MPAYDVDLSFARAQSLIGGATGGVPYQTATSATTFVTIGVNGYVLTSNGTSPQWSPASATTVGTSTQVNTILRTTNATHYLTFVDSNNASSTPELVYTTSTFSINPATGAVSHGTTVVPTGANTKLYVASGGTGLVGDNGVVVIETNNGSYPALVLSNWNGGTTTVGPYISFSNSGLGTFHAGGANGTNSFDIGTTWGTPLLRLTSTGQLILNNSGTPYSGAQLSVNGAAYINGITTVTNSIVQSGGYAYLGNYNSGTPTYPSSPAAGGLGLAFALNFSAGNVEQNIWNTAQPSTYSGTGIRFMQYLTASTYRDLLFLSNTGAVGFGGTTNYGTAGQVLQSNGNSTATWVSVSGTTVGTSTQVQTVLRTTNATHYLTFVDSNNASATAEAVYTTSSFTINASTGLLTSNAHTVNGILNVTSTVNLGTGLNGDVLTIGGSGAAVVINGGSNSGGSIRHQHVNGSMGLYGGGQVTTGLVVASTGIVTINTITNSISTTTGALVVSGGVGIGKTLMVNERITIGTTSTTNKFEVAGTSGQLFSVSDSFTGTIFAASDISGIPSIEVLDTGLVKFAQYNGQVTIGTGTVASSSATLSVYGMLYTTGTLGEIRASSEITAYFSSDRRLKENIKLIEDPITMIDQISGVYFDWTDEHIARRGGEDGYFVRKHDIGVIAQEIEAVMPEVVAQRADGFLAVKYEKIVPLLIEAIKAQQVDINLLKSEIQELKNRAN